MARDSKSGRTLKPLFAKLPVSLHIALQEVALRRWKKTGVNPDLRDLLTEAIMGLAEAEGVSISQIEANVSTWDVERNPVAKLSAFPRRRGPKPRPR